MNRTKKLELALVQAAFMALSPCLSYGGVAYDENRRLLVADIDSDDTLTPTQASYLTNNQATNFVKRGVGMLTVSLDLSAYLGDIHVDEGVYRFTLNTALGKLDGESVCGSVYVKSGATLDACNTEANAWTWWNKRIVFAGEGAPGWGGALTWSADQDLSRMVFSSNLVMSADATINNRAGRTFYMSGGSHPVWLDMNGSTLTCRGNAQIAWGCLNVKNPGHILVDGIRMVLQNSNTYLNGDARNTLSFANLGYLGFNCTTGGGNDWTLDAQSLEGLYLAGGEIGHPEQSYWSGPLVLGSRNLEMSLSRYHFSLYGPISGCGMNVTGNGTDNAHLHLYNAANDFTNGITAVDAFIHLHENGSMPVEGASLSLTRGGVVLEKGDENYDLPKLLVSDCANVSGGSGKWSTEVVKTGSGDLVWDSASGTELLNVESGRVVVRGNPRAQVAGLVASSRMYYTRDEAVAGKLNEDWAAGRAVTNNVVMSPTAYYNTDDPLWTEAIPEGKDRYMIAFVGYIWNNEVTNVTWSFAGAAGTHVGVSLDGDVVFRYENADVVSVGTVENVTPGPHAIDIRGYSTVTWGSFKKPEGWPETNFAVGFDPLGRGTALQSNYIKLIDPGDGSLLTWDVPGNKSETVVPGTGMTVHLRPEFQKMRFGSDAGIVFERESYETEELEGLPSVEGLSGGFTIGAAWKVDAADIVANRQLVLPGRLVFKDRVKLTMTDLGKSMRGSPVTTFTIAIANGGIEGTPVLAEECSERWKVWVDGNAVKVTYFKPGLIVVIR